MGGLVAREMFADRKITLSRFSFNEKGLLKETKAEALRWSCSRPPPGDSEWEYRLL